MPGTTDLTNSYYYELAARWANGTITAEERQALEQWYSQGQDADVYIPASHAVSEEAHEAQLLLKIQQKIAAETTTTPVHRIPSPYRRWWTAAAVILLLCAGSYIWQTQMHQPQPIVMKTEQDVAPGKTGAILTLADGRTVLLDSMPDGVITQQQGAQVIMHNGALAYQASGNNAAATAYNTISTPNGRQFSIALQDGTKVWLNAASSISFPAAFTGAERVVAVTGEAYFEVAKGGGSARNRPFKVQVNKQAAIEVLGTHFNVNAYSDETSLQTTLLEGAVRVTANNHVKLLKPGQQAQVNTQNTAADIAVIKADVAQAVAWKEGSFYFKERTGIQEVMRQLARWYDIEVVYENGVPDVQFTGEMERNLTLKQVVKGLDDMGVSFTIEGRKLLVRSATR